MRTRSDLKEHESDRPLLPAGVRGALLAVLGVLLASAIYLVAVRGQALLLDLAALSQRVFCF